MTTLFTSLKKRLKSAHKLFIILCIAILFWLTSPDCNLYNFINLPAAIKPEIEGINKRIKVAKGFQLSLFTRSISGARMLYATQTGDLLVSQPHQGKISLLQHDNNHDGHSDHQQVLLSNLNLPHGIAVHKGWLYVAETHAIGRIQFNEALGQTSGSYERINTTLPTSGNHWSRTLKIGPDSRLYVSVGSSCNVCIEKHSNRATILSFKLDGSDKKVHASGLRNSVGFDWHPITGDLYATDNGRDHLGDDIPPCELNKIVAGGFYGWPYAYGNKQIDPNFGKGQQDLINQSISPVHHFKAHSAPLGIAFLAGDHWPKSFQNSAIVALHGSWNRTEKQGYKLVSLQWGNHNDDNTIVEQDFVSGFEIGNHVIGRPVDIATTENTLYFSDDYAGLIYQITAVNKQTNFPTK